MAKSVSEELGIKIPNKIKEPINQALGADSDVEKHQPQKKKIYLETSTALSQANTSFESIATRQIACLVGNGFNMKAYDKMKKALEKEGAVVKLIAPHAGTVMCDENMEHNVEAGIATTESVLFDAIYIPGGRKSIKNLLEKSKFVKFVNEAYKHCKAIAVDGEGEDFLHETAIPSLKGDKALLVNSKAADFISAIAKHRNWERMGKAEKIAV